MSALQSIDLNRLTNDIKAWGRALGFQQVGISDVDLSQHEDKLLEWLGETAIMAIWNTWQPMV